ncbi:MAG: hypothetical protein WCF47_17240, partial [Pseudolabrys sp.]
SPGGAGCAGRLGIGVTATDSTDGPDGLGLTAAFAVGVAFLGDECRTGAFAGFFLAAVFLRVVALATGGFLRFALVLPLAFFLVGI